MDRREWANYLRAFARDGRRGRLLFAKLGQFFSEAPFSYELVAENEPCSNSRNLGAKSPANEAVNGAAEAAAA